MLSLFESNRSVSVWMPDNFGYRQDRIKGKICQALGTDQRAVWWVCKQDNYSEEQEENWHCFVSAPWWNSRPGVAKDEQ